MRLRAFSVRFPFTDEGLQIGYGEVLKDGKYVGADGAYLGLRCKKIGSTSVQSRFFSFTSARLEPVDEVMKSVNVLDLRILEQTIELFLMLLC